MNCDGIRDRTKFISKEKFTNLDFLSDFRLLQECGRNVESWKKNKDKQNTRIDKELPMVRIIILLNNYVLTYLNVKLIVAILLYNLFLAQISSTKFQLSLIIIYVVSVSFTF